MFFNSYYTAVYYYFYSYCDHIVASPRVFFTPKTQPPRFNILYQIWPQIGARSRVLSFSLHSNQVLLFVTNMADFTTAYKAYRTKTYSYFLYPKWRPLPWPQFTGFYPPRLLSHTD